MNPPIGHRWHTTQDGKYHWEYVRVVYHSSPQDMTTGLNPFTFPGRNQLNFRGFQLYGNNLGAISQELLKSILNTCSEKSSRMTISLTSGITEWNWKLSDRWRCTMILWKSVRILLIKNRCSKPAFSLVHSNYINTNYCVVITHLYALSLFLLLWLINSFAHVLAPRALLSGFDMSPTRKCCRQCSQSLLDISHNINKPLSRPSLPQPI